MTWPAQADMLQWLQSKALPPVRPPRVYAQRADGLMMRWRRLDFRARSPRPGHVLAAGGVARGDVTALWATGRPRRPLSTLAKLYHDLLAVAVGAAPRYFAAADLPQASSPLAALARWVRGAGLKAARSRADRPSTLDSCWKRLSPGRETLPTLQTTNAFLTMSTPSTPPVPASAVAGHQGKGQQIVLRTFLL